MYITLFVLLIRAVWRWWESKIILIGDLLGCIISRRKAIYQHGHLLQ